MPSGALPGEQARGASVYRFLQSHLENRIMRKEASTKRGRSTQGRISTDLELIQTIWKGLVSRWFEIA